MKKLFQILLFLTSYLLALPFSDVSSFQASFSQIISSNEGQNNTLFYQGIVKAQRPNYVVWHYQKPVKKSLYIGKDVAFIVDYDLEQVTIKKLKTDGMFFELLQNAKKLGNYRFVTHLGEQEYLLVLNEQTKYLKYIIYSDQLDNSILIKFENQKVNQSISVNEFKPKIPNDFDKIYQ
jgi:outer membrane lipoprotein-sorting protein